MLLPRFGGSVWCHWWGCSLCKVAFNKRLLQKFLQRNRQVLERQRPRRSSGRACRKGKNPSLINSLIYLQVSVFISRYPLEFCFWSKSKAKGPTSGTRVTKFLSGSARTTWPRTEVLLLASQGLSVTLIHPNAKVQISGWTNCRWRFHMPPDLVWAFALSLSERSRGLTADGVFVSEKSHELFLHGQLSCFRKHCYTVFK